ncbi:MAG TPA: ADP-glyceromanno-heptose 6-epimerase, partial [Thermoanaerobaculia bacterium]
VHMGAISATTELSEELLARFNVDYSKMVWHAARRLGVPCVYASSAAVYGDGSLGFDDDDTLVPRLRPLNPYGESKRRFDLWALEEAAAGRTPPAWSGFRFFNVYGFGERHKGGMASVVLHGYDQAKAKGEIRLFESHRAGIPHGHQSRDFVDVSDAVEAIWFALRKPVISGIYNVGTGKARTFLDLAKAVFTALGAPERIVFVPTPEAIRERYQYFTEAKMDRLRAQGFAKKSVGLEDGVDWYVRRLEAAQG